MADTSEALNIAEESLKVAAMLSAFIPVAVGLYNKIKSNNENAGLADVSTLLADVQTVAAQGEATAQAEIDKLT